MARNFCVIGLILVTTLLIICGLAIGSWLVDPIIALSSVFLLGGRVTLAFWSASGADPVVFNAK